MIYIVTISIVIFGLLRDLNYLLALSKRMGGGIAA